MAYADQKMSGNRVTALVIVALIHVVIGYALVSGLAYQGFKAVVKKVQTIDVKEEKKPDEPPPPPPKQDTPPPPIVAPPPPVNVSVTPPAIQTVVTPPPVMPPPPPVLAAPAAPPPPAPKVAATRASPRSAPGTWVTTEDYPSGPLHEGAQGVTGFKLLIGVDGKVTGCEITSSSGNDQLDKATCTYASRRARFKPAMDSDGKPMTDFYIGRVRWEIPKD